MTNKRTGRAETWQQYRRKAQRRAYKVCLEEAGELSKSARNRLENPTLGKEPKIFGNFTQFPPKHYKAHTDNIRIMLQIWKFAENIWNMLEKEARRLEANFSDDHPYLRLLWTLKSYYRVWNHMYASTALSLTHDRNWWAEDRMAFVFCGIGPDLVIFVNGWCLQGSDACSLCTVCYIQTFFMKTVKGADEIARLPEWNASMRTQSRDSAGEWVPGTHWPASVVRTVNSTFRDIPCLRK